MERRIFSKQTFNGLHLVRWSNDPSPVGYFRKLEEKDEYGFLADENSMAKCPNSSQVNTMGRPWGEFIIVPSLCQQCPWVYQTPDNEFDCLLKTKDRRIRPSALVRGGE